MVNINSLLNMKNTSVKEEYEVYIVEHKNKTYFCSERPWFHMEDQGLYWWGALAVDENGSEYIIQWACSDNAYSSDDLAPQHIHSIEQL